MLGGPDRTEQAIAMARDTGLHAEFVASTSNRSMYRVLSRDAQVPPVDETTATAFMKQLDSLLASVTAPPPTAEKNKLVGLL